MIVVRQARDRHSKKLHLFVGKIGHWQLAIRLANSRQDDLSVLSQTPVAPNVMLLIDTSASMANAIWHDDFDPNVFYDVDPAAGGPVADRRDEIFVAISDRPDRHVVQIGVCAQ